MGDLRAIIYGVGEMGSIIARLLLDRGVSIVGAVGRSPHKVGRDLGEVAGLGRNVGVTVEADPRRALAQGPDIAVVCVSSYLSTMRDHFAVCLEHGVNVITIEEETVFPWNTDPVRAAELDAIAKANGVTLAASGAQDVFWVHLVGTLLGASHVVEAVEGKCTWNVDDYGPEVAAHVHVGDTPEAFERHIGRHGWPDFVARATLEAIISELLLSVESVTSRVTPVVADAATFCECLNVEIPRGHMLGIVDSTEIQTEEGPRFRLSMEGRLYRQGETDLNEWQVTGEPNLHLRNDRVPTRFITCSSVVNRIPDVVRASPGLVSLERLGKPTYKHGPIDRYLP